MPIQRRAFLRHLVAGLPAGVWLGAAPPQPVLAVAAEPSVKRVPTAAQIRASRPENWRLVDLINQYRRQQKLPEIPLSPRLTVVATLHVHDLAEQRPQDKFGSLHSWSLDPRWKGGAYRSGDKTTWGIMWDKAKEITGYPAVAFEICATGARDMEQALEVWRASPNHHPVILSRGVWAEPRWRWQALGAVFFQGFACAWFGNTADA